MVACHLYDGGKRWEPCCQFQDVKKYFPVRRSFVEGLVGGKPKYVRAVDGVNLDIQEGEVFVLVGESGSGKTTLGKLGLRVYIPTSGKIFFEGQAIASLRGEELKKFRRSSQMVYQDPVAALNPRVRIGDAVAEPLKFHRMDDKAERREAALRMMRRVGFDPPEEFYSRFPHELSGGQRQRVVIARALDLGPEVRRGRRARGDAGRLHQGSDPQATPRPEERDEPDPAHHYPRPRHSEVFRRPRGDNVPRPDLGEREPGRRYSRTRCTPTPRRSSPPSRSQTRS